MSQFALRLPDSLAESIKRLAEENRVSINQYVIMTLAEKVSVVGLGNDKRLNYLSDTHFNLSPAGKIIFDMNVVDSN